MSEPAFVVMPIRSEDTQPLDQANQVAAAIEQSLHEKLHPGQLRESSPQEGLLNKVMVNQDSLYKYISWDDPVRTMGSYIALLGLFFGVHHLHLTQLFLKVAATGLGAVSIISAISRSTKNDFAAKMRPKYKQVPEATLNATLNDIHDLIQWSVVQVQKVMYGQDLGKTVGSFLGMTALFWLTKFMSPFALAIMGLSTLYIAPLITSPRGREVAGDAKVLAQELSHIAAENAKAKAGDLSSMAQQTAGNLSSKTQQTAENAKAKVGDLSSMAQQTAGNLSSKTKQTADNVTSRAHQTAENLQSRTKQTAGNLSHQAQQATGTMQSQTQDRDDNLAGNRQQTADSQTYRTQHNGDGHSYNTLASAGTPLPKTVYNADNLSYNKPLSAGAPSHSVQQATDNIPHNAAYNAQQAAGNPSVRIQSAGAGRAL